MRRAVVPPYEDAQLPLEGHIALGAAEPSRFPEIGEGCTAFRTGPSPRSVRGTGVGGLPEGVEKSTQGRLGHGGRSLDPALSRAAIAELDLACLPIDDVSHPHGDFPLAAL